jgi:hypothetical protein
VIDDATTSTQNNIAITNQHSGQTNSALVLSPKGSGALIAGPKPNGAASGGNARGIGSNDFGRDRDQATQVASGNYSVICGGQTGTASGSNSAVVCGTANSASGNSAFIGSGFLNAASGGSSVIAGGGAFIASLGTTVGNTASGLGSAILGGLGGLADRYGMQAHASGRFSALGDAQRARFVLRNKTTNNTATELYLDGAIAPTRLTIPSGKIFAFTINISGVKSDGSAVAHYLRQYALKNVAGTTTEVYAPVTIGTDNAAGTIIALSANDTNDALKVEVTGITSEIWRWVASVDAVEIAYGI